MLAEQRVGFRFSTSYAIHLGETPHRLASFGIGLCLRRIVRHRPDGAVSQPEIPSRYATRDLRNDGLRDRPASIAAVQLGRVLTRAFFDRPCLEVASDLVGVHLVRKLPDGTRLVGRIVEVEAYLGDGSDPGSHSHKGETQRNRSMFGAPGRIYAYRIYGIHTCVNVVCEPSGSGAAILLRALEPLEGIDTMRRHRGLDTPAKPSAKPSAKPTDKQRGHEIARGPGRLAEAMQIGMSQDSASLLRGAITLRRGPSGERARIPARSRRIGLTKGADLPYRFYQADSPWVCRLPPSKKKP